MEYFPQSTKAPKGEAGMYPDPIIISAQQEHRQTIIILHGRGSFGARFGPPLLSMISPTNQTLQTAFSNAKLIFLTASRNKAVIYKNKLTHQWFDHWHPDDFNEHQDLMPPGLKTSCEYVHGILQKEIDLVGEDNVVLWGLSQGGATTMSSLLTWDGKPFAAAVVMCAYLPFGNRIQEIANNTEIDGHNMAVKFFRNEINMGDCSGSAYKKVPVFMGHGTEDEKVPLEVGREAKACLDLVGVDAEMIEYEGLGHWYSPEMLGDIFGFLNAKLGG